MGDTKLIMSPREARMVGQVMAGAAQQFIAIEMGHAATQANGRLRHELRDLRRKLAKAGVIQPEREGVEADADA